MISTASGRSAFIVAAGLLVLLANPVTAAPDADDSAPDAKPATAVTHRTLRHAWHHRRHYVHRRSHTIAAKADARIHRPAVWWSKPKSERITGKTN